MAKGRSFSLKIEGEGIEKGGIGFKLLAGILNGVQDTFYYIGLAELKRAVRARARIPLEIQRGCELRRVLERPGSYEVVAEVAAPPEAVLFPEGDLGWRVLEKYLQIVNLVTREEDLQGLADLFPDSAHRKRILRSMEAYCPKEGEEWRLSIGGNEAIPLSGVLGSQARDRIRRVLYEPEVETMTVTGELVRLHLDEHKLGILYPLTRRVLDCFYDPDLEDFVVQNLKGMLQVTGRVQLDANGFPEKIVNATEIAELDLSPVRLTSVTTPHLTLVFNRPLAFSPVLEDQELVVELPEYNIIATGATRDAVIKELENDLIWVWREYGLADDAELSADARQLKQAIRSLVREVQDGAPPAGGH